MTLPVDYLATDSVRSRLEGKGEGNHSCENRSRGDPKEPYTTVRLVRFSPAFTRTLWTAPALTSCTALAENIYHFPVVFFHIFRSLLRQGFPIQYATRYLTLPGTCSRKPFETDCVITDFPYKHGCARLSRRVTEVHRTQLFAGRHCCTALYSKPDSTHAATDVGTERHTRYLLRELHMTIRKPPFITRRHLTRIDTIRNSIATLHTNMANRTQDRMHDLLRPKGARSTGGIRPWTRTFDLGV